MGNNKNRYIARYLDVPGLVGKKSYFLLGPRQTGKTTLIRKALAGCKVYDLLDSATFVTLSRSPGRITQELGEKDRIVVIDEIQRLPVLLNEVHRLIEEKGVAFLLTGSSARKLRRGGVNLLGGRARIQNLHPLTSNELKEDFELSKALSRGLLPSLYFSDDPDADLQAYTGLYLREEVIAEGAIRNIPAFSRFLKAASFCNGTIVNFTNVANDAQVARTTVYEYFDILKDTLILHEVPAWKKSKKRKPLSSSKYYFFDTGVVRALQGRVICPGTPEYGEMFETFIMHELRSYISYISNEALQYWRSASGYEVDFILGDHTAIEVKAKENVPDRDLRPLAAIAEEKKLKRYICVSLEKTGRVVGPVMVLPYREFLSRLWNGELK
ncbi:MAG: DUF4143 domain-containing protein [Candidatus Omnitrophota bacterium]